jgi:hypothetical protein
VTKILNGISTNELQRVFPSWIERVENQLMYMVCVQPRKYPAYYYVMWAPVLGGKYNYGLDAQHVRVSLLSDVPIVRITLISSGVDWSDEFSNLGPVTHDPKPENMIG